MSRCDLGFKYYFQGNRLLNVVKEWGWHLEYCQHQSCTNDKLITNYCHEYNNTTFPCGTHVYYKLPPICKTCLCLPFSTRLFTKLNTLSSCQALPWHLAVEKKNTTEFLIELKLNSVWCASQAWTNKTFYCQRSFQRYSFPLFLSLRLSDPVLLFSPTEMSFNDLLEIKSLRGCTTVCEEFERMRNGKCCTFNILLVEKSKLQTYC